MTQSTNAAPPTLDLDAFLAAVKLTSDAKTLTPMISANRTMVLGDDAVSDAERFASSLAAVVYNVSDDDPVIDKQTIQALIQNIDKLVESQLNEVLHDKAFQQLESTWTSVADLVDNTTFSAGIDINLIDVTRDELGEDLDLNQHDIAGSELFKKLYVAEYDQFGGKPYGALVGLYDFGSSKADCDWLRVMGKIAKAAHAPFIANVAPRFFSCDSFADVNQLRDIGSMVDTPRFGEWNKLRNSDEAVYLGLVMPRYLVRPPWNDETNPAAGMHFEESITNPADGVKPAETGDQKTNDYLWGYGSMLLARNLVRSFKESGWCQYLRGVKGGGLVAGLPTYSYDLRGEELLRAPTEISMPDFRELELANAGLIPIIHKKNSADAVFFSVQSLKKPRDFKDPKDAENSQLTANLSYTFSVSRIAHYIKCIMRDNIGSSANAAYIQAQIDAWISRFVTTVVNPDDLTLRYFPFKAYSLNVAEIPGQIGWYHCDLAILPHIQFEGMNVDLRVDARLGGK